ncbi:MAG: hypothetical protein WCB14_16740, partial [Candidatus Acidiferrales bacterium]
MDELSNSGRTVRLYGEAQATGRSQHSEPSAVRARIEKWRRCYGARSTLKENTMRFMMIMYPESYRTAKAGFVPNMKD